MDNVIIDIIGFKDEIIVKDIEIYESQVNIFLELKKKEHICPKCKEKVNRVHDYYVQKIKDLNMFDKQTFIVLKKRRYKCKCGKVFQENNNFLNKYQRMTKRMFSDILKKLETEYSFTSIGKLYNISVNTVIRAFDRINYPKTNLENTEVLAIDEFKGNTGGEKYNCIIADPQNKIILDILPNRKYSFLSDFFLKLNRENIKTFIADMWLPYRDLSRIFFKKSNFVVDKYHWVRQVIWAFENVRKEEQKKFFKTYRMFFKKSKSLLTKRFKFLTEEQKQEVNIMIYKSNNIREAYSLKEEFLKILENKNRKKAKEMLSKWIMYAQTSNLKSFEKCANTMIKWSDGILNSFDTSYTNGYIEGCNNKIKVLKRNAYGYKNFKRFRNRILHIFNNKKPLL